MADVAQAENADHPPALVDHRQPADLEPFHVLHRLGEVVVLAAAMDALGHHVARGGATHVEAVFGQTFADDVAVGDHADQLVVLADRNGADVVVTHQFGDFGDRGIGTDPVDALVHYVFDFHGRPPCGVRVHSLNAAPVFPSPASIQRI